MRCVCLSQNIPDFVGGRFSFASRDRSVQLVSGLGKVNV